MENKPFQDLGCIQIKTVRAGSESRPSVPFFNPIPLHKLDSQLNITLDYPWNLPFQWKKNQGSKIQLFLLSSGGIGGTIKEIWILRHLLVSFPPPPFYLVEMLWPESNQCLLSCSHVYFLFTCCASPLACYVAASMALKPDCLGK